MVEQTGWQRRPWFVQNFRGSIFYIAWVMKALSSLRIFARLQRYGCFVLIQCERMLIVLILTHFTLQIAELLTWMLDAQKWFSTGKVGPLLKAICVEEYGTCRQFIFPAETRFAGKLLQIKRFHEMKSALQLLVSLSLSITAIKPKPPPQPNPNPTGPVGAVHPL